MLHTQSTWFPFITYVKTGAGLRGVTPSPLLLGAMLRISSLLSLWFDNFPFDLCHLRFIFQDSGRALSSRGRASQQRRFTCQATSLHIKLFLFLSFLFLHSSQRGSSFTLALGEICPCQGLAWLGDHMQLCWWCHTQVCCTLKSRA